MQWENNRPVGLLDTNIIIHAHTTDALSAECRRFLAALERGELEARLEPIILHELSYMLPRILKQLTRADVAALLLMVLGWRGVRGEIALMLDAVRRWSSSQDLAFAESRYGTATGSEVELPCIVAAASRSRISSAKPAPARASTIVATYAS